MVFDFLIFLVAELFFPPFDPAHRFIRFLYFGRLSIELFHFEAMDRFKVNRSIN